MTILLTSMMQHKAFLQIYLLTSTNRCWTTRTNTYIIQKTNKSCASDTVRKPLLVEYVTFCYIIYQLIVRIPEANFYSNIFKIIYSNS